ncbi:MAG: sigma-70 family RNA polymerase sigma factor [Proteobacteria bacterium]|nr:sigma-70 family RNA polymerase sigma factor [Pseudomonadota bacterium]
MNPRHDRAGDGAPVPGEHEVTKLIAAWRHGDTDAREALVERVYANVRAIAAQSLRSSPAATLGTTDLAHEALIRLLGAEASWQDRRHLFHVVAQATRQVLVDAARRRLADKRGSGAEHVALDAALDKADPGADANLIQLDDALRDLARTDARRAQIVELVYFGGLERAEVAASLEISETTVDRDLRLARAWLRSALEA